MFFILPASSCRQILGLLLNSVELDYLLEETLTSPIVIDCEEGSFRLRLGIRQRWQFSDAFVDGLLLASVPMPHSATSLPNRVSKFKVFLDWVSYDGGDVEFASVAEAFSPDQRVKYLLDNVNCAS